ncbi:TetR/AcrR family transcriptional regulator [Streptomyces sp. NPDC051940]|uniref:TetR/AcrR family transcriptional regulator n=1 Tax=Streptomyces sp. NPDC051940 TaxID=3155675 RepID=UPI00342C3B5C
MSGRRQEILQTAMDLADERGLAAVSMRAVADRVGVTPMALYPHVGSKAALLDGMVGTALATLLEDAEWRAAAAGDWRVRLRAFARVARRHSAEHPWVVGLLFSRPAVTPDAVAFVDQLYGALLDAGVPPSQVPRMERLFSTFVLGFVASENGGRFAPGTLDPRDRRGRLPEGALPRHTALAGWLDLPLDLDEEFEADLADLERLVEAAAG